MSEHKYMELANRMRMEIATGKYSCGQRLPSENELANDTGYSRQTVRQAMALLEHEGLTNRVQGSGTYVKSGSHGRTPTHNIAVVTTYIGEYIFPAILSGVEEVFSAEGYTFMLFATKNKVDNERKILLELLQKPIDGLIVEGTKTALPNPNIDLYEQFREKNLPVVFINGFYPDIKKPVYVVTDDRHGGYIACQKLLSGGKRNIAGIFKSDDIQGHRRYAGFTAALQESGITVNDDHILWYTTENRDILLATCALQVLSGCDGVVCYNDEVAMQVISLLQLSGQEIDLVSFDNSTYAQLSNVSFLSLTSPKEEIGRLAATKLTGMLRSRTELPTVLKWKLPE